MKIKIMGSQFGLFFDGQEIDAAVSDDKVFATVYAPKQGYTYQLAQGQFIVIEEKETKPKETAVDIQDILTLREQGHFSVDELVKLKQGGLL